MSLTRIVRQEIQTTLALARHEKLTWLVSLVLLLMLAGSVSFYIAERGVNPRVGNYFDALYWSIVSATTTGYGDIAPITAVGRASAIVLLLSFMSVMPLLWATVTSIYVSKKIKGESGLERVNVEGQLIICGWNNNANSLLTGLEREHERRHVVIVGELGADHYEDLVQRFPALRLHYVKGQYTNEATLNRANVKYAKGAIVLTSYSAGNTASSDDMAVLAVLALRELGPNLRIVAECFSSSNKVHLYRAGADRVIVAGELDGYLMTAATLSPGLDLALKEAMTFDAGNPIWTHPIPQDMVGRTFKDLAQSWLELHGWITLGLVRAQVKLGIEDILSSDRGSIDEFILRRFEQAGRGRRGSQPLHYLNPGSKQILRTGDQAIVIYPAVDGGEG